MSQARHLSLTPAHIAKVHRDIPDPGPTPGRAYLDDQDFRDLTNELLGVPQAADDVWLFAFGSLIWKPGCEIVEQRPALLKGWHRSFCMKLARYRGTPECPGLMMALQNGGEVEGVIQRIPAEKKYAAVEQLLRRELSGKPPGQPPIWVRVECEGANLHAFVFALRQDMPFYAGNLSADEKAEILSKACGHWGSGAEYLMNTVQHLEGLGIHDPYLWDLQERVAKIIAERHGL